MIVKQFGWISVRLGLRLSGFRYVISRRFAVHANFRFVDFTLQHTIGRLFGCYMVKHDAAQAAGAILDEKTIKSANELQAATWLVEQSASGLKNQLSTALIPILSDLADSIFDVT
ncbi:hypothetical protein, partial [Pseudomonas aeruginosa]|uniref:hypothetical protein n=1 Tax=Pseudomonas aeruginosa TaxID=287 RepID=UPI000FEFA912